MVAGPTGPATIATGDGRRPPVTLSEAGWLRANRKDTTRWEIGARVLSVRPAALQGSSLFAAAREPMIRLRDALNETIHLPVPDALQCMVSDDPTPAPHAALRTTDRRATRRRWGAPGVRARDGRCRKVDTGDIRAPARTRTTTARHLTTCHRRQYRVSISTVETSFRPPWTADINSRHPA